MLPASVVDPLLDPPLPLPLLEIPLLPLLEPLLDPLPVPDVAASLPPPLAEPLPLNAVDVLSGSPGSAEQAGTTHVATASKTKACPR
jgi:hypothetical protein